MSIVPFARPLRSRFSFFHARFLLSRSITACLGSAERFLFDGASSSTMYDAIALRDLEVERRERLRKNGAVGEEKFKLNEGKWPPV